MDALLRILGIRPGEGRIVAGVAALFALLEAARGFGEVGADSLVLATYGPDALPTTLPYLFIALGLVSLAVSLGYSVALGRLPRIPLFLGVLLGIAALLILLRIGLASGIGALVPVVWLIVFASSAINLTIAWTVSGATFDARQAKRLFPMLTAAAIGGSFVGTLAAGPVARLIGVESLVVVQALLLAAAAVLLARLPRRPRRSSGAVEPTSVIDDLRAGFDTVVRSPLMRLVALAYVLLAVLMFSLNYPFMIAAARQFPNDVELATALGLLSAAITATSFVISLALANRIYARFGISAGALALPLVYAVGFAGWLVQFSFASAAAFRYAQQATQRGVSNAAWSAFYNVVPASRRAQALAFNDGVPGQVGTILSGLLLLVVANLSGLEPVFWLGLATAVVASVIVLAIRRRYADSLLAALRSGLAEQVLEGGPGLPSAIDRPEERAAVVAMLDAGEPATRRLAASILGRAGNLRPEDRTRLVGLLDDPDPAVRAEAAVAALTEDPDDERSNAALEALLVSTDDDARIAGLDAAARIPECVSPELLAPLLSAERPAVRAAAIAAAAARPDATHVAPTPALIAALDDPARVVRSASAGALAIRPAAGPDLIEVLRQGTPDAIDAALAAVGGHASAVEDDLLAWARGRIERAEDLHRAHTSVVTLAGRTETLDFLDAVLDQRARSAEDRAIAAVVAVGAPSAGGLMRRSLRSTDQDARAQAIEALDSLGGRDLGRALTACLEAVTDRHGSDPLATLVDLTQDDDPWIASLSRSVREEMSDKAAGERSMSGQDGSGSELETMLLLRRVPLFAGLEPEDLQRVAAVSIEREYPSGVALMREGDLGDELIVLVDGSVRVVQAGPNGEERFIRRYEAGEHIGELAVLRDRPRIATVIAEGEVRGLVLGGDGLRAILRERPEAAMAMLATLAERISSQ